MDGVGGGVCRDGPRRYRMVDDRPPTVSGINENTSSQTRPSAVARWISRAALVVGLVTVVLGATVVQSTPARSLSRSGWAPSRR